MLLAVYCPVGALVTPTPFTAWTGDGTLFLARVHPDAEVFKPKGDITYKASPLFACRSDALCVGPEPVLMLDQDLNLGQTRRSETLECDTPAKALLPSCVTHPLSDANARYFDIAWVELLAL